MDHLTFDPPPGLAIELEAGLRRILAPNPSPMTFRGTNTYLLGHRDLAVIDPGPDLPAHLHAILAAIQTGQQISHIFVTHAHLDHSPLARQLSQITGAPVLAFGPAVEGQSKLMQALVDGGLIGGGEGVDTEFSPDRALANGEIVTGDTWTIRAIWTPGHMANHMAFAWQDVLFTGDLVMGWASSLVSPPDGDVAAFLNSCQKLVGRSDRTLFPGHGPPVTDPVSRLDWLIRHRHDRETQILSALSDSSRRIGELVDIIYHDLPRALHPAAARNVLAHLIDMHANGRVTARPELSEGAVFRLVSESMKKTPKGYGRP